VRLPAPFETLHVHSWGQTREVWRENRRNGVV